MRFLSMIRLDEKRGQMPSKQLMNDTGKLLEKMNPRRRVDHHCIASVSSGQWHGVGEGRTRLLGVYAIEMS